MAQCEQCKTSPISDEAHETRKVKLLDGHTQDQVENFQVTLTVTYQLQCCLQCLSSNALQQSYYSYSYYKHGVEIMFL